MSITETGSQAVRLKNGSEEFGPLVAVTMMSIRSLNPVVLYELREKCKNQNHQLWGNSGQILKDLALVQPGDFVHDSIRNIVLSAVTGEGIDLVISSPFAVD